LKSYKELAKNHSPFDSLDVLEHHLGELVEGDLTITIGVNLVDDLLNDGLIKVLTEGKDLFDFINGDRSTTVLVEHLEGRLKFVIAQQVLFIHSGNNELRVIDGTTSVGVNLIKHFIDFSIVEGSSEVFGVSSLDFILGEFTVAIEIHGSEDSIDLLFLLLGQKLTSNESEGGLLQL